MKEFTEGGIVNDSDLVNKHNLERLQIPKSAIERISRVLKYSRHFGKYEWIDVTIEQLEHWITQCDISSEPQE